VQYVQSNIKHKNKWKQKKVVIERF